MRKRKPPYPPRGSEPFQHIDDLPSRAAIQGALERIGSPVSLAELAAALEVRAAAALDALGRRVNAMVRDGQVVRDRAERLGLVSAMELIGGRVISHRDGYAFVRPESAGDDIYLAPREARRTLHGDRVLVRIAGVDHRGRPYGHLVEVLERANARIVGRYFREHGIGFVVADNHRINQEVLVPDDARGAARDGQIVVAEIELQPDHHTQPIGRIVEVLGEHMAPGMESEIAIRSHDLPAVWPEAVLDDAARVPLTVHAAEHPGRRDLRDLPLVTIDGADARDFDDALYARATAKGYTLVVAIADVSHYVTPGSALDDEARRRGTSVYFPDRVIPMLPERLSNGTCSLNPGVERLALVCELTIGGDGETRRAQFYPAVIRSHARLVYEHVEAWHHGEHDAIEIGAEVAASLATLYDLYQCLRRRREQRGALDIDTVEPRFVYGPDGKIARVEARSRVDAHRLVEECMIAANVAAARFLARRRQPALYRVHEAPDPDKAATLARFLGELGLSFAVGDEPTPADYAAVLVAARSRVDRQLIDTVVLRSLKLAVYSADNSGHFGLALPAYAHFTSPIRRYPDLVVHRAIGAALAGEAAEDGAAAAMAELASHCSMTERRADEASRDVVAWLKCEFMLDKVGEVFSGIVAGVAEFGLFVELQGIFVEGLVHVTELPADYYHYDAVRHCLRGRSGGREFRLAQAVEVRVARVDLDQRKIDFTLAGADAPRQRRGRRRP